MFHLLRHGFSPKKVFILARKAFNGNGDSVSDSSRYDDATILRWLYTFYRRFFVQQFKRSCLPDGPKVGSVSLSPRGDWRMPTDAMATSWLQQIEELAKEEGINLSTIKK